MWSRRRGSHRAARSLFPVDAVEVHPAGLPRHLGRRNGGIDWATEQDGAEIDVGQPLPQSHESQDCVIIRQSGVNCLHLKHPIRAKATMAAEARPPGFPVARPSRTRFRGGSLGARTSRSTQDPSPEGCATPAPPEHSHAVPTANRPTANGLVRSYASTPPNYSGGEVSIDSLRLEHLINAPGHCPQMVLSEKEILYSTSRMFSTEDAARMRSSEISLATMMPRTGASPAMFLLTQPMYRRS